jgi:hypothetical protein
MPRALFARVRSTVTIVLPLVALIGACAVRIAAFLVMSLFFHVRLDLTFCLMLVPVTAAIGIGIDTSAYGFARLLLFAIPIDVCCPLFIGWVIGWRFRPIAPDDFALLVAIGTPIAAAFSLIGWLAERKERRKAYRRSGMPADG